jgi:hypothetical protein
MKYLAVIISFIALITPISFADSFGVETATEKQVKLIGVLLNPDVVVLGSAAIRSASHQRAYYVGLNFRVPDVDETLTGVWIVSGDRDEPGGVLAVDGYAKNFSRATAADKTKQVGVLFLKRFK